MPRKNCNAERIYKPDRHPELVSGSRINTTGESIVREFRVAGRGARIEIPVSAKPISTFEKAVRIFLIFTAGWFFGYLHHFLAGR